MAHIQCSFHSEILKKSVSMNVIIPQQFPAVPGRKFPVVYLLHGLSDDHSMWCRRTSIERYAAEYNFAVIMPDGGRSFYTDALRGENYWSFIAEELPQIAAEFFPIATDRENCFAAGLSMGGYGAIKLALRAPERFAAVAGLSSLTDIKRRYDAADTLIWRPELENIFGSMDTLAERGNDLFALAEKLAVSSRPVPQILSICGTEDFMITDNRDFTAHMEKINFKNFHYFEYPGTHNWQFWDTHIQSALRFFASGKLPEK